MEQTPQGGDTFPRPDPTRLTTEMLRRELQATRELFEAKLGERDAKLTILLSALERRPTEIRTSVNELKALQDQKFTAIDQRFSESKVALDTAMSAAKEAAGKTESSLTKQLDSMAALIGTTTNALSDKIDDAKGRLTLIEGRGSGLASGWGYLVGAVGLAATVALLLERILK
jgi:hypothetical protein